MSHFRRRAPLPSIVVSFACAHAPPPDRSVTTYDRSSPVLRWDAPEDELLDYVFEAELLDGRLGVRSARARQDSLERLLGECPDGGGRMLGDGLAPAGLPPEFAAWVAVDEWQDGSSGVRIRAEGRSVESAGLESQEQRTHGRGHFRLGRVECVSSTRTSDSVHDRSPSPLDTAIRDFGDPRQQDLESLGLVHERGYVRGRMGRVGAGYELSLHISGLTNALSVSALESTWSLLCRSDAPIYVQELPVALSGQPLGEACRVGVGPAEERPLLQQ